MPAPDPNAKEQSPASSLKTEDFRLQTTDFSLEISDLGVAPLHDCWNTIGVAGDQSCGELSRQGHCHNCPVYARAAAQFLDRPLPPRYRLEWTEHFAPEKPIAMPAKTSAVLFRIGPEWLGLPTVAFQEIAEFPKIRSQKSDLRSPASGFPRLHSLPHRRRGIVLGIINVRGELLICASLGKLLGLESEGRSRKAEVRGQKSEVRPPVSDLRLPTSDLRSLPSGSSVFDRLLVAAWQGQRFAFPVDEVHGVHRFHSADLREPPATVARSGLNCAIGVFPWRHYTVGYLEPESLFGALNRNLS